VISTVWNAIKTVISNVMKIISSVLKGDWEGVKKAISNIINAIKSVISSVWNAIKNVISSVMNGIKNTVSSIWNGIKSVISSAVNSVKSIISSVWNGIKNTTSSVFNGIKTTASKAWNDIKNKMTAPIEKARDTIKGIVDRIKGFFSGMSISIPKIKLPHFSISPSGWKIGDLLEGSIPKLGISWYAKAMDNPIIMTKPTIFGYNGATGELMGGGEVPGGEVVSGTNTLMNMIQTAVAAQNEAVVKVLTAILNAIVGGNQDMIHALLADKTFKVGEREFARLVREYA
jgi:phage-related protein